MVGLACLSISTTGMIEGLINQGQRVSAAMEPKTQELTRELDAWQAQYAQVADTRMKIEALKSNYQPPIPAWFMSYLANVVPPDLILTKVSVRQRDGQWVVDMTGRGGADFSRSAEQLTSLERELAEGPFHMVMTNSWRDTWLETLRRGVRFGDQQRAKEFAIQGTIG